MANRVVAAEPQMPKPPQGTWCPNEGSSYHRCKFEVDMKIIPMEITAKEVNTRAFNCVVRRVIKFDVCPWGMIYKNRERAGSKIVSDKPVGARLSHRTPMHRQRVENDGRRLANRKGNPPGGRSAARLSVSVG